MPPCFCVIPARGGSKRIPRKNIKDFCGMPMLAHSIKIAQKSGIFTNIFVSTEDVEIAKVAQNYGADLIRRLEHLSDDYTSTRDVMLHSIEVLLASLSMHNIKEQVWLCCLYATAPLLDYRTLQSAFTQAKEKANACYCFGAVEYAYNPYRAFNVREGRNAMLFRDCFTKRSQDLEKVYHDAGQFYFATAETWLKRENIFEDSISIVLPTMRVQDIDTLEDWSLAELKYKLLTDS